MTENLSNKKSNSTNSQMSIDYDYLNQSLLTVENVRNILYTISPELSKLCYVTFDYPDVSQIIDHKYSIINIKQFFNIKNNTNVNVLIIKNNGDGNIYYDEDYDEDEYGEGIESKNENLNDTQNALRKKEDLNKDLENESKTSFSSDNIGHFIIIINNHPTCIIYPLYYINCFNLENYLKNDCGFKNVVWNYNIIQHGNSSSCGWECCKIAYDYFAKNNIEVECKDYKLVDV